MIFYVALGIGILIIVMAIVRYIAYQKKVNSYYKTEAEVVGNEEDESSGVEANIFFSAILQFKDKSGNELTLTSSEQSAERPSYNIGDKIWILVNPEDATRFVVFDAIEHYVLPLVWLSLGIGVIVLGFIFKHH
ncbi:MAG: DUF3592 domain-containing protein [Pedobacter sp.]|nr:DUF3592 domain-containing protein [Chitinophagaceae bacterium]